MNDAIENEYYEACIYYRELKEDFIKRLENNELNNKFKKEYEEFLNSHDFLIELVEDWDYFLTENKDKISKNDYSYKGNIDDRDDIIQNLNHIQYIVENFNEPHFLLYKDYYMERIPVYENWASDSTQPHNLKKTFNKFQNSYLIMNHLLKKMNLSKEKIQNSGLEIFDVVSISPLVIEQKYEKLSKLVMIVNYHWHQGIGENEEIKKLKNKVDCLEKRIYSYEQEKKENVYDFDKVREILIRVDNKEKEIKEMEKEKKEMVIQYEDILNSKDLEIKKLNEQLIGNDYVKIGPVTLPESSPQKVEQVLTNLKLLCKELSKNRK